MGTKKAQKENIFIRYIKGPIWVLARVRDLCVLSLTGGAGHVTYGNAMGCPTPQISSLPRSFSTKSSISSEEELRDMIRSASTRNFNAGELRRSKTVPAMGSGGGGVASVPHNNTVAFRKIDEDGPCEFEGDDVGLLRPVVFQKSRSYAVVRSKMA